MKMKKNGRKQEKNIDKNMSLWKMRKSRKVHILRRVVLNTSKIIVNSLSCGFAGTSRIVYAAARACANLWLAHLYSSTSFRLIFTKKIGK